MKKTLLNELRKGLSRLLTEEVLSDLFTFLETDPKNMTMGTAYYVASMDSYMNKFITNPQGEKIPNPMLGRLFKNTRFIFKWQDTYGKAMDRKGLQEMARRGVYDKIQGYEVLETGKSGLYLPIIPTGSEATYSVLVDGQPVGISKEEIAKYLRPMNQPYAPITFRPLIIDKVIKLTGGKNVWINPNFKGPRYLGIGEI
jgi:hypothetical protein